MVFESSPKVPKAPQGPEKPLPRLESGKRVRKLARASNLRMAILDLQIDKMHCGSCVRRVTQTLNALPGTHANSVAIGAANVSTAAAPERLLQALQTAGFPARVTASRA